MTGMLEHELPGLGHNKPSQEDADEIKHGKWDRWAKKRTFVRALEGTYSHLYKKLLEEPRVYSSKDHPWKGGPAMYGKHIISAAGRQYRAVDRVPHRSATRRSMPARSTAISTARCSTCSRATAMTCTTAAT